MSRYTTDYNPNYKAGDDDDDWDTDPDFANNTNIKAGNLNKDDLISVNAADVVKVVKETAQSKPVHASQKKNWDPQAELEKAKAAGYDSSGAQLSAHQSTKSWNVQAEIEAARSTNYDSAPVQTKPVYQKPDPQKEIAAARSKGYQPPEAKTGAHHPSQKSWNPQSEIQAARAAAAPEPIETPKTLAKPKPEPVRGNVSGARELFNKPPPTQASAPPPRVPPVSKPIAKTPAPVASVAPSKPAQVNPPAPVKAAPPPPTKQAPPPPSKPAPPPPSKPAPPPPEPEPEPEYYEPEPQHYEPEPQHYEPEPQHYEPEPQHYEPEPQHYEPEPQHYEQHYEPSQQEEGWQNQATLQCKALYMYPGEAEGDLIFNEGDIINILDQSDPSGWWQGELNGVEGFFPSNFVQMC